MKLRQICSLALCGTILLSLIAMMSGCRRMPENAGGQAASSADILYQTYCEDSYKGYQLDNMAALTFYVDGTYSIAHCIGINDYIIDTGTWTVEDGVLSIYNPDGDLVGNGDGTNINDIATWGKWGLSHYDNKDGTFTDYYSTYAFEISDNGDFILTVDDQTYYYWGQNGHISSQYIHTFTASEFIEAYNGAFNASLTSIRLNAGTASPLAYYG